MNKDESRNVRPKKGSAKKADSKKKVEFKGYVNWTLNPSHKQAFTQWLETGIDIDDLIDGVVEAGYSLKVRYDTYNQCISAGLYCEDANSPNAGWNLSMRASTSGKAMLRVLFVHLVALDQMWETSDQKTWDDDAW